ncbi:MAG: MFS transporter [Frankia sp.]
MPGGATTGITTVWYLVAATSRVNVMTLTSSRTARTISPITASIPGDRTADRADRRRWLALLVLLPGQAMAALDASAVNVAIPDMGRTLHASGSALQLIVSGYTLAYAVLLVTGARLGDDLGYRRTFVAGLAGFTLASATCAVAPVTGVLIVARVLQGAAAALMVPQVLSVLQREFVGPERARALGLYAAVLSGGVAAGQVLGGALVSADLFGSGWRLVFAVNIPIGVALMIAAPRILPVDVPRARERLDLLGVALLSGGLAALVLPLVVGRDEGWPAWTFPTMAACPVLVGAFAGHALRLRARGGRPVLDVVLLADPGLRAGLVGVLLTMGCWASTLFALTLFLQSGLGYSPIESGVTFVPAAIGFALASLHWGRLPARTHRWIPTAGRLLAVPTYAGVGLLARDGWSAPGAVPVMFTLGVALGCGFSPSIGQIVSRVAPRDAAGASGLVATTTQIGFVVGVATFGSVYLTRAPRGAGESLFTICVAAAVVLLAAAAAAARAVTARPSPGLAGPAPGPERRP